MDEFIFTRMHHSRTYVKLLRLTVHELTVLIREIIVKVLTTDGLAVGIDFNVLQALTALRKLLMMINILWTL